MKNQLKTLLIAMLALGLSAPVLADNMNTTIQQGGINMNRSHQKGTGVNDNATYQEGRININKSRQKGRDNINQTGQFATDDGMNVNESHQKEHK